MNDSRNRPRIKVAIDWPKGIKMDIPYSRWVMFSVGAYVLAAALFKLAEAFSVIAPLVR